MAERFDPYPYQERVANLLLAGKSVILQAPTGSGKTAAALLPFLHTYQHSQSNQFPHQCVYSVPVRALANQFKANYEGLVRRAGLTEKLQVLIQTGERPDDPKVIGDLVFTTIDQTLSNILCVPYAVGSGSANINAGAVISSYLVFDEFHLFPPDGALKTTVALLSLLNGITPFVLMTATFSTHMLDRLKAKLNAEVVTVSHDELAQIPSQKGKIRRYHTCDKLLEADDVWSAHRTRSIALCNTVERAQILYEALAAKAQGTDTEVMLLHARFIPKHRKAKEESIRAEFGDKKEKWSKRSLILVATQVIEVGLDITSENLHTEIAPANAVFQRAGRCARFADERGDIFIYNVPLDNKGKLNYAPYIGTVERELCGKAWGAFQKCSEQALDFFGEQDIIDVVHTAADTQMLEELEEGRGRTWEQIRYAITQCDPSMRPDLIRDSSESCTLLVHDDPYFLENPFVYRGFSIYCGSLFGKWKDLQAWAQQKGLGWILCIPQEKEESESCEDAKQKLKFEWLPVPPHAEGPIYSPLYVVHPALIEYDERVGFRFSANGGVNPADLLERAKGRMRDFDARYQLESYPDHIKKMTVLYRERQADRLVFAATRLEQRLGLPSGSIDRAARLAIAFHDVGKMQVNWQAWARNYEKAIGENALVSNPDLMIAHTHSETEEHRAKEKSVRPPRPHHAGEGAAAMMNLIKTLGGEDDGLYKATMTAIARHHSPHTDSFGKNYRMHASSPKAVLLALQAAMVSVEQTLVEKQFHLTAPTINFDDEILGSGDPAEAWLIYLLIVRALRLVDGESQEGGE